MENTKKIIMLLLALALCMGLCACGQSGKYKTVKTLQSQGYYLGFRNDDQLAFYVTAALKVLQADGTVGTLSQKWFGENKVKFDSDAAALDDVGYIAPRTLIVGVDENAFPISSADNGVYSGFDVELAQAVCAKLGWETQFISIQPQNAYVELSSGNVDVAWGGMTLDPKSTQYASFGPYMENDVVVAALSASKGGLSGKTLYMDSSSQSMSILDSDAKLKEKFGQITRRTGGAAELFASLDAGECDLILTNSTAVQYKNTH